MIASRYEDSSRLRWWPSPSPLLSLLLRYQTGWHSAQLNSVEPYLNYKAVRSKYVEENVRENSRTSKANIDTQESVVVLNSLLMILLMNATTSFGVHNDAWYWPVEFGIKLIMAMSETELNGWIAWSFLCHRERESNFLRTIPRECLTSLPSRNQDLTLMHLRTMSNPKITEWLYICIPTNIYSWGGLCCHTRLKRTTTEYSQ